MLNAVATAVERFFHWWGSELAACLPSGLRGFLGSRRRRLVVTFASSSASFARTKGEQLEPIGQVDLDRSESGEQDRQVRSLLGSIKSSVSEVTLRLTSGQVLVRRVTLPSAAEENLREVLSFEMDRNTPFRAEDVLYDARVVARDGELKTITVELVMVARSTAQDAIERLRRWDLEPDRLEPEVPAEGERSYNLLSRKAKAGGGKLRRRVSIAAGLASIALAAYIVTLPLIQKQELLAKMERQLTSVRAEALRADQVKSEVQDALARSRFMVELKQARPPAIELLDEVTRLLPDSTWLLHFAYRGERVNLAGYSAKPTDLIGLLERSDLLEEVVFTSPVTMDLRVGRERFNLSARVEPRSEL